MNYRDDTDTETGRKERGRTTVLAGTAAALALAVVAAVVLGIRGNGGTDGEAAERLASICGGLLPTEEIERFPATQGSQPDGAEDRPGASLWDHSCSFAIDFGGEDDDRPEIDVRVGRSAGAAPALKERSRAHLSGAVPAVPLGDGWEGVMLLGSMSIDTTVIVPCAGKEFDIVVTTSTSIPGERFRDANQRGWLGRLSALTARNAAEERGCDAEVGNRIATLPAPPLEPDDATPIKDVRGTCRSLTDLSGEVREIGGSSAFETQSGSAPVEDCVIADASGEELFRATALYGPFAQQGTPGRSATDTARRTTLECRGATGLAEFHVRDLREQSAGGDHRFMDAFLAAFSKESAERHGCTAA